MLCQGTAILMNDALWLGDGLSVCQADYPLEGDV